jgi:uncharacterized protein
MTERNGYQHGVPCWVDTWQPDADAAAGFYSELFGWEAEDTMPAGIDGKHYICRLGGRDVAAVASRPEVAPDVMRGRSAGEAEERPVSSWTTYVWVDDVDGTVAKVREAGGSVAMDPFDALDGGRIAIIADPSGAALGIWQPGEHRGAQLVNAPSAWAMSSLSADDPEGMKRFYSEVFGWEASGFEMGGAEMTLFRVPGYVGGKPQQPVPRDVVAVMVPPSDDGGSRWTVGFWVADVEAAVRKVADGGGEVLAPPNDVGGLRNAVVRDPQGALLALTEPPGA